MLASLAHVGLELRLALASLAHVGLELASSACISSVCGSGVSV